MADETYDFAIVGSSLAAMMVAGLLAQEHGRRVILVGRPTSGLRLSRLLDLLFVPATTSGTWALLAQAAAEIGGILTKIGAEDALRYVDMAVEVERDPTAELFDHVAHLASGYGVRVHRTEGGWLFRGIPSLDSPNLHRKLPAWLENSQVTRADVDKHPLSIGKDGALQFNGLSAAHAVLCDDDAILHLPEEVQPPSLRVHQRLVTLLEPVKPAKAEVQNWPDRRLSLVRRPDNQALAFVNGVEEAEARLASVLSAPARRLAAAQSRQLVSNDGAPLVGMLPRAKSFVAAGLGDIGAFLAPALARLLAGTARAEEHEWLKAYAPFRSGGPGGRL